jgi:hypothetical protein
MGSFTAQILVGSPHPNHDGIIPTHSIFLSENSQPAWVLVETNVLAGGREEGGVVTWIPTQDALEDAILMMAVHVAKSPEVLRQATAFNSSDWANLAGPSALKEAHRKRLYQTCRSVVDFPKIVVSVFRGSLIDRQLPVLEQYKMDVEVCRVGYSRLYSAWMDETRIEGSLDGRRMELPRDIDRPFFAYGLFRPGQLGFLQLRDCVSGVTVPASVPGYLLLRDGLPIIDPAGQGFVTGALVAFLPGRAAGAYERISAMEPDKHYRWDEATVLGTRVNVLFGRSPGAGRSEDCVEAQWNGWDDPFFKDALDVVQETLDPHGAGEDSLDVVQETLDSHGAGEDSLDGLFRLQMAYLLLWSSIERYASLRYRLGGSVNKKLGYLAEEAAFGAGLRERVNGRREVYRADSPSNKEILDRDSPKKSIYCYYQMRSNITHRGKTARMDQSWLKQSLEELLPTFREMLTAAERDAAFSPQIPDAR